MSELRILVEEDNNKKVQYAYAIIGSLYKSDLKKTVETFFEKDLNLTETAKKMGIHPNTVTYRLNKIQQILGLDPRKFEQASSIKVALLTSKLFA